MYMMASKNFFSTLTEELTLEDKIPEKQKPATPTKSWKNLWRYFGNEDLKWFNIIILGSLHIFGLYCIYHIFIYKLLYFRVFTFYFPFVFINAIGVTAGAHRYYTHKCFKMKFPLRVFLVLAYASAGMNTMYQWVRDHRVHHRFQDTVSDPHNAKRGFFFSHVGWLLMEKSPECKKEGRNIDMSDVLEDPIIQFEEKYFVHLSLLLCHILPTVIPWYFFNDEIFDCFCMNTFRWICLLNGIWSVNSAAHIWGTKPYDKDILPSDNIWVSVFTCGEGWHNYHHTFPWDFKAGEFGRYVNLTGCALELFAKLGWVYDMKFASNELIERVVRNKGDGSRYVWGKEVPESESNLVR